jgi:3',5'-cyclic AMP phosphodiesterase CpdA
MLSKRATGWYNWRRTRRDAHDMTVLAALVADIHAQNPDHIACTGDTCNIGLPSEWATSKVFMEGLGSPALVSFVPGNHDAYVPGALEGLLKQIGPWARDDAGTEGVFPFVQRHGDVALVGLSSAIPTLPFVATGRLGSRQRKAVEAVLTELGRDPQCFRVVLIHHPPHVGGATPGRQLTDAEEFEEIIKRAGAELILHGHNHVGSLAHLDGPRGSVIPIIGAPSASASVAKEHDEHHDHPAGYHLYTIGRDETGFFLTAERRGVTPSGSIGGLGMLSLARLPSPAKKRR